MNYGKIYIATKDWQSGFDVINFDEKSKVAYFTIKDEQCKCNLVNPVVYHKVNEEWLPFDYAHDVVNISTPDIQILK